MNTLVWNGCLYLVALKTKKNNKIKEGETLTNSKIRCKRKITKHWCMVCKPTSISSRINSMLLTFP